jgi:Galactose oxidase, central domain
MQRFVLFLVFLCSCRAQWLPLRDMVSGSRMDTSPKASPAGRRHPAVWCVENDAYLLGGEPYVTLRDFWKYEGATGRWIWMPNPPAKLVPRSDAAVWETTHASTGKVTFWLFGGRGPNATALGDFWSYNPETRQWTQHSLNLLPTARWDAAYWVDRRVNRLYIYGGAPLATDDMWYIDVDNDAKLTSWTRAAYTGNGPGKRRGAAAALGDGSNDVFLFGGFPNGELHTLSLDTHVWKAYAGSIVSGNDSSSLLPRQSHVMWIDSSDQRLHVFGGYGKEKEVLGDTWTLEQTTAKWEHRIFEVPIVPAPRADAGYCNRKAFFMTGGVDGNIRFNDAWAHGKSAVTATNILVSSRNAILYTEWIAGVAAGAGLATCIVIGIMSVLVIIGWCRNRKRREGREASGNTYAAFQNLAAQGEQDI